MTGRASDIDVPWSVRYVLGTMADVQQLLAGVSERQAQAGQQDLARLQQTTSNGRREAPTPTQLEQGIGAFASKCQPQPSDVEDDRWKERVRVFRSFVWTIRNDPVTINDLELTLLKYDPGHVRNIATELYHFLIIVTSGRAQRLVRKATELELEAYRLFFGRYEPFSTVTAVAKLVDLW